MPEIRPPSHEVVIAEVRRLAAEARPGERIEPSRSLVRRLGVSPVTVQRALDHLVAEGLLLTRPGAGTFVATPPEAPVVADVSWQSGVLGVPPVDIGPLRRLRPAAEPGQIVLSSGYLDTSLQAPELLTRVAGKVLRRSGAWDHTTATGDPDLRAWLAHSVGGNRTSDDVVTAPGGQAALASTVRALAPPGSTIVVESPTYPGAVVAARAAGCHVVAWPVEPHADPEELDRILAATGATVVFTQSRFANPTGRSWDAPTRRAVLAVVRRRRCFVIDDDWAADLALDGEASSIRSLAVDDPDGHVVTIRSVTKLLAPGLRLAAVVARGPARDRIAATCLNDWVSVSGLLERVAIEVLSAPPWRRHLEHLRTVLVERRDVLVDEVERRLGPGAVERPDGGLHVWVRLPHTISAERLAADAAMAGVIVSPGAGWYPAEAPGPRLRLSYSAADPAAIRRAVAVLADLAAIGS